ncbi:hypothetical protein E2C01_089887 [Portunus trituberculatus]|uniref:Uncharacterized protein n=1 Tax=Portunus trituberculatus TaxID=210409 RepID=A0A5B7JNN3_PORTR|nr:hypothetical protein [Portunus trituberculatus]
MQLARSVERLYGSAAYSIVTVVVVVLVVVVVVVVVVMEKRGVARWEAGETQLVDSDVK